MHIYEKYVKRLLDFLLSGTAILLFSPIILVIAILVRRKLGTPVLFIQERPGKNEKIFKMYKFRTMTDQVDATGHLLPDEVRLTAFGKRLRATSLDELPELFNIFIGDMSFVGPRPLLVKYLPYYRPNERIRHSVRPGLTGLAQINGRNFLKWEERFALDVNYVENLSFALDVKIIFGTIRKVLEKEDVMEMDRDKADMDFKNLDEERYEEVNQERK